MFLSNWNRPVVEVEVEGNRYAMLADLGTPFCGKMQKDRLNKIVKKVPIGEESFLDLRGNQYSSPGFVLDEMKLGELEISEIEILEENLEFIQQIHHPNIPSKKKSLERRLKLIDGKLGRGFFQQFPCYFDLLYSRIYFSEKFDRFQIDREKFVKVPLELDRGLLIEIDTSVGKKKFLIDSGATHSLIRESLVPKTGSIHHSIDVKIGGADFGKRSVVSYPLYDQLPFDGVLGADFFLEYGIAFDFENKAVYIEKEASSEFMRVAKQLKFRTIHWVNTLFLFRSVP